MRTPGQRRLRTRVTLLFLLAVAPAAVVVTLALSLLDREIEREIGAQADRALSATERFLAQREAEVKRQLQTLSESPRVLALRREVLLDVDGERHEGLAAELAAASGLDVLTLIPLEGPRAGRILSSAQLPHSAGDEAERFVDLAEQSPIVGYERELFAGNPPRSELAVLALFELPVIPGRARMLLVGGARLGEGALAPIASMGRVTLVLESEGHAREVFRGVDSETILARRSVALRALDGQPKALLSVEVPPDRLQRIRDRLLWLGGALVLFALAWALTVGPWFARRLTEPILELSEAAARVTEGDLGARVRERGQDELGALIRRFNEMTAELGTARDGIARAERLATWREAAQRIAHEIKNPLFPMQMAMETLRKAYQSRHPELDEIVKESTQAVLDEVRSLSRLVSEFSEFARLPKPARTPVSVLELLEQCARIRSDEAVHLDFDRTRIAQRALPPVLGDQDLLARALSNLLKNAEEALAGRPDPRIELDAELVRSGESDFILIRVEDNGPGIPEELKDRVFTPYFTTKAEGTGLGLAIVERIVVEHGGQIDVSTRSPSGTRFTVRLPAAPGAA